MIITIADPHGYCFGVKRAIEIALSHKEEHPYLLGSIIHNSYANQRFVELGYHLIDDSNKTRLELLEEIPDNSTVIISAHGVSPLVIKKMISKNIKMIDATCPVVSHIHQMISSHLKDSCEIFYIGKRNHPESEGVLGISPKIHFITDTEDIRHIQSTNKNSYIFHQTTLDEGKSKSIEKELTEKLHGDIFSSLDICTATKERQKAILSMKKQDLFIVVGDKSSSNSKELYHIANGYHSHAVFVSDLSELKELNLNLMNKPKDYKIGLSSGSSTPDFLLEEIVEYLQSIKKE